MSKKIFVFIGIILAIFSSSIIFAIKKYEKVDFEKGIVTASALNVRTGPGLDYDVIENVYKNDSINIFAKIGEWYVVQTPKDKIGTVNIEYVKPLKEIENKVEENIKIETCLATEEEKELLKLINEERKKEGLNNLNFDEKLQNVAKEKANDLIKNNYFSHTSPIYGSPFDMMKKYGVIYKAAGENIAGNPTLEGAVKAWMESEGHKENILSNAYNYTGIGIVNSEKYGKIMVQMFIGK